jgi:sugar phosphate isomerase/epimerase
MTGTFRAGYYSQMSYAKDNFPAIFNQRIKIISRNGVSSVKYENNKTIIPKITLSSRYSRSADELIHFALTHGLEGIEYTIQVETNEQLQTEYHIMQALAASGLEIRYHLQFKEIELSHCDVIHAERSAKYLKDCIDLISFLEGRYAIVHLCLGYRNALHKLRYDHALKYLEEVVSYGNKKNVRVCLENLTFGFTCTPSRFLELLKTTGAAATVDIGHAAASPVVKDGIVTAEEFITTVSQYIQSAHVYDVEVTDKETNHVYHAAPGDKSVMTSRLNALLQSNCNWWLIELGDADEILQTASFARAVIK